MTVFPLRRFRPNVLTTPRDRALAAARLAAHSLELRRLLRDLDPDLVIAWGMRSALALLLGPRPEAPVVFQHNDLLPGGVRGRLVRGAAARASLCVALSGAIARDLGGPGLLRGRLRVVHPGIDVDRVAAAVSPASPPEVLFIGTIAGWKRPDVALEAIALVRRQRPDVVLRVVGAPLRDDGDALLSALRARAARPDLAGAVEFAGALDDAAGALARATCLLHCAPREPFGMAVLEALAAGRPAVVPAAEGPAEIVDEDCGRLYRPGDAAAAAGALLEVLSDERRAAEMGERGRERARVNFGLARARAEYRAAVEPLVRRRISRGGDLAIVTVTRNSGAELAALLSSVGRHLPATPVVVVDCASVDDTVEVARSFDFVRVVALGENVGFARGCNRGLAEVRAPATALLNPDVELVDASLGSLAAEALRGERPERLLAPLVLYPDGSRQDSVHPLPGTVPDWTRALVPPALVPGGPGVWLAPWRARRSRKVGWAVGAALVARTETLRRLGPFDERIFLYGEDLDLGIRAGDAGIETWFWPAARVLHRRAHSTSREFGGEAFETLARARHDVVLNRWGARAARLDDASQAATFRSRAMLKRALRRPAHRERRQLEALRRVRRMPG